MNEDLLTKTKYILKFFPFKCNVVGHYFFNLFDYSCNYTEDTPTVGAITKPKRPKKQSK